MRRWARSDARRVEQELSWEHSKRNLLKAYERALGSSAGWCRLMCGLGVIVGDEPVLRRGRMGDAGDDSPPRPGRSRRGDVREGTRRRGQPLACLPGGSRARIVLGHVRLAIIDLSDAGFQPMTDETARCLGRLQRRDLQLSRTPGGTCRTRPSLSLDHRYRSPRARLEGMAARNARADRGNVRLLSARHAYQRDGARARPARASSRSTGAIGRTVRSLPRPRSRRSWRSA